MKCLVVVLPFLATGSRPLYKGAARGSNIGPCDDRARLVEPAHAGITRGEKAVRSGKARIEKVENPRLEGDQRAAAGPAPY
jgi:hypothetical protein